MGFSKVIPLGEGGSFSVSEDAGIVSIKVAYAQAIDGARANLSVDANAVMSAVQLEELAAEFLKAKYPAMAGVIDGIAKIVETVTASV